MEHNKNLEHSLAFSLDQQHIDQEVEKELKKRAAKARFPGFRPGKAPMSMVRSGFYAEALSSATNKALNKAIAEGIAEKQLSVAAVVDVELDPEDRSKGHVILELTPTVTLPDFSTWNLNKVECDISAEDVENTLLKMRQKEQHFHPVSDRPSQRNDRIIFDCIAHKEGEAVEGTDLKKYPLVLGSGSMIPGFEEALQGLAIGEEKAFPIRFPEDYGHQPLAGVEVIFTATISEIESPHMPDLDDAFASQFIENGTVEGLRQDVKKRLEIEKEKHLQQLWRNEVYKALVEQVPLELPASEIEHDALQQRQRFLDSYGNNKSEAASWATADIFRPMATRNVKLRYLMRELVKHWQIEVTDLEIEQKIAADAEEFSNPDVYVEQVRRSDNYAIKIETAMAEEKILQRMAQTVSTTVVKRSFSELSQAESAS